MAIKTTVVSKKQTFDLKNVDQFSTSSHFMRVVDDVKCTYAKCILVTCICVSVCLSVAACPQYCKDLDVTRGNGRGCPLVAHYGWICNQCTGFSNDLPKFLYNEVQTADDFQNDSKKQSHTHTIWTDRTRRASQDNAVDCPHFPPVQRPACLPSFASAQPQWLTHTHTHTAHKHMDRTAA